MTTRRPAALPVHDKAWRERVIFRLFAKAARLPVKTRSIRSRPEPEPDIRCSLLGDGPVAFELGEIVTPGFAEATNQRQPLRQQFREAYGLMPETVRALIETRLGGAPTIQVGFARGTSPGKWRHAIPPILATLADMADCLEAGEVPVWRLPAMKGFVDEIHIQRDSGGRASLHVMELTEVFDETQQLLTKKFRKQYGGNAPTELVAYYISQPPSKRPDWLAATEEFIKSNLTPASPFRRVWLFDHFRQAIPLVYPPAPLTTDQPPTP